MERDILRKAAAYFAKTLGQPRGRLLIRNVYMVLDRYIGKPAAVPLRCVEYSRTI